MPDLEISKALEMSKKTPIISSGELQWNDLWITWVKCSSCKTQELPGIKADWQSVINWFWKKKLKTALKNSLSNIFLNIGGKLIGLQFFKQFLLPLFWTGIIWPFFQSSGKIPAVKDDSDRYFEGFAIDLLHSCIMRIETLSHPCALLGFKFLIIRSIPSSFISISLICSCVL